jgi:Skp family chaperone for outer membrane proteins
MKAQFLASAVLALTAFAAAPAAAQLNGIGVAEPAISIASSQAFQTANQQIATTFQAQRTQLEQLQQQRATAVRQFDTNNDGQLSQEEQTAAQANTTAVQQLQTLDQQIEQIQRPITLARVYVVEQIAQQLNTAFQQVVTQNNLQLLLNPSAAYYINDAVELSDEITAALNTAVPTVSTAVPEGWQPQQQTVNLFQQVQDILVAATMQQQQAAAAAQPQAGAAVQGR